MSYVEDFYNGRVLDDDKNFEPKLKRRRHLHTWIRIEEFKTFEQAEEAECTSALYLLYHATDVKVSSYPTENGHSDHTNDPKCCLYREIKEFIDKKFQEVMQQPNATL